MEKKAMLNFEIKKDTRTYVFTAPIGAPLGETHDVLYEILKDVWSMAKEQSEKIQKKEESDKQD